MQCWAGFEISMLVNRDGGEGGRFSMYDGSCIATLTEKSIDQFIIVSGEKLQYLCNPRDGALWTTHTFAGSTASRSQLLPDFVYK